MSDAQNCGVCDAAIDPYGRDFGRCARCSQDCQTCGQDVARCIHPLPKLAIAPRSELNPIGSGAWFA